MPITGFCIGQCKTLHRAMQDFASGNAKDCIRQCNILHRAMQSPVKIMIRLNPARIR